MNPELNLRKKLQTNAQSYISKIHKNTQDFDPFYSAQHLVFIGQGVVMISLESRDNYVSKRKLNNYLPDSSIWFNSKYLGDPLQIFWDISRLIQIQTNPYKLGCNYLIPQM